MISTVADRGLVVIGAGGHGREAIAIAQAARGPEAVLGVLDDAELDPRTAHALDALGVPHLGGVDWLCQHRSPPEFVVAVGLPAQRRSIVARAEESGARAATLVHPSAVVGPDVELGPGVVVWPHATLTCRVRVGRHSHLNVASSVSHDGSLGEFVTIGPGARVCGTVTCDDGAWIGAGAVVIQGVHVGADSVVGAGAVVLRAVEAGSTVVGVPAHAISSG